MGGTVRQCKHCGVLKSLRNFGQGREQYRCERCAEGERWAWEACAKRIIKPWAVLKNSKLHPNDKNK